MICMITSGTAIDIQFKAKSRKNTFLDTKTEILVQSGKD